ncbi:hypothetical protein [Alkalihalobacillus sp. BA299]|uniref:hypothetical protein n=1 Tax=Alkalihalobacillus sp. BA299 TaxID=2815938 RepID=UPI001ADB35FD|nr:hypothetical protein [Alkalihalobacillus sp. BA299]
MNEYEVIRNGESVLTDSAEGIRIWMEDEIGDKLNFIVMLQENDDDDELEVYLHTDNYEDLESEQLLKLNELGLSEHNSLQAICKVLDITVLQ